MAPLLLLALTLLQDPAPQVSAEVDRATVILCPIRFGSGTRLKVLEAMAHRVPLVTTSVGCEGIDVVDGTHARIVDDASGFARACVELLGDPAERIRLATAAEQLYQDRYRWSVVRAQLADLARDLVGVTGG